MDIRQSLKETVKKFGDKPAIIFKEDQISFNQLQDSVLRLSKALSECGVNKGDKVGIFLPNCPEYTYSYLACFFVGAVGIPLDFMLKDDELISCMSHAEVKLLIALPKPEVSFDNIKKGVPSLEKIVLCKVPEAPEGFLSFDKLLQGDNDFEAVSLCNDDPALIMYTSGTTGKPKGILLNVKHLEGSPQAMDHFVDLTDKDVKLAAIPLSHIAGFVYLQNCILFGITLILMERFHPVRFLKNIQEHKVTCFHIVPAMYMAILSLKQIEKFDLSSLRWVVVFGAPSTPEIMERFHQYCPNAKLLNGWGMTETCPPNTVTPLGSDNIASIGKPAPHCEIKIYDDQDNELPSGEIGEIVISGWVVFDSYYKDPELTNLCKRNGKFHTGDLGCFDKEGFLYIRGRKKEMIKVGGQIVFAPEVEAALFKNEMVQEAAVIGMPDELRGEVVKAFVVLKEDADVSAEDLRFFVKDHLANFKVPQSIEVRTELPKNRTGKIDKELLKDEVVVNDK